MTAHTNLLITRLVSDLAKTKKPIIQLMAKSPSSKAAQELLDHLSEIRAKGILVKAVFASAPSDSTFVTEMDKVYGAGAAHQLIRVSNLIKFDGAREQINFGKTAFWIGNRMNALMSAGLERGALHRVTGKTARLSNIAFVSAWAHATPVVRAPVVTNDNKAQLKLAIAS